MAMLRRRGPVMRWEHLIGWLDVHTTPCSAPDRTQRNKKKHASTGNYLIHWDGTLLPTLFTPSCYLHYTYKQDLRKYASLSSHPTSISHKHLPHTPSLLRFHHNCLQGPVQTVDVLVYCCIATKALVNITRAIQRKDVWCVAISTQGVQECLNCLETLSSYENEKASLHYTNIHKTPTHK